MGNREKNKANNKENKTLGKPTEETNKHSVSTPASTTAYSDVAIGYANSRGSAGELGFLHVPSGATTYFMAFVTDFSDQFTSEWNEENIYGRMDPIATFQRTGRKITVGWDVPADSYDTGFLGGVSFAPDMEAGFFDSPTGGGAQRQSPSESWMEYVGASSENSIAPKVIKLSVDFTVLHERQLGWGDDKQWIDKSNEAFFPYQIPSGNPDDTVFTGGGMFGGPTTDPRLSTSNIAEFVDDPDLESDNGEVAT